MPDTGICRYCLQKFTQKDKSYKKVQGKCVTTPLLSVLINCVLTGSAICFHLLFFYFQSSPLYQKNSETNDTSFVSRNIGLLES